MALSRAGAASLAVVLLAACGGDDDEPAGAATTERPEENLAVVLFYDGTPEDEQQRVVDKCGNLPGVSEVIERPPAAKGPEVGLLQDGSSYEQRVAVSSCLAGEQSVSSVYGEHHDAE